MRGERRLKVLFVCLGNICRSPVLHHILKQKVEKEGLSTVIEVDSSAVESWNIGDDIDPRMREAALKNGYQFPSHKAKLFKASMLSQYDYIFVVTNEIIDRIKKAAKPEERKKILLATHYSKTHKGKEIQDPYYGDQKLFEEVFQMIDEVIDETLVALKKELS